jgi:hypothetical protein
MMSAFEVYKEYLALKNHFTKPEYDYFKYCGKLRVNVESFNARKDKLWFQKLAKHPDVHNFLVANLSKNEKAWIKDLAYSEVAEQTYTDWLKRNQSLSYSFKGELAKLHSSFNENFIVEKNHSHPYLLQMYLGGHVSLETMCILLALTGAKKHWDSKMEYDPIYEEVKKKIEKYTPFIKYDKDKLKKIVIDYFE